MTYTQDLALFHSALAEDELMHYGVLGMKWGVRKAKSSAKKERNAAYKSAVKKLRAKDREVSSAYKAKVKGLKSKRKADIKKAKVKNKEERISYLKEMGYKHPRIPAIISPNKQYNQEISKQHQNAKTLMDIERINRRTKLAKAAAKKARNKALVKSEDQYLRSEERIRNAYKKRVSNIKSSKR